jgi:D-3-phosphoglycerate dehydrogenase / 2-oxoglutarate reductase
MKLFKKNSLKILITTVPFGDKNPLPLQMLEDAGIEYLINPLNKKLTEDELFDMVADFDVIIAGTEKISAKIMDNAPKLKLISRVGIGLDGVDLNAAKNRKIAVSYTPDAPTSAVAEITVGMMLSLLRSVHLSNIRMHNGHWQRYFGKRIANCTVGIIGLGRIGKEVLSYLKSFNIRKILVNDLNKDFQVDNDINIEWVDKKTLYKNSDIISLHLPLTPITHNLIKKEELNMMKNDAVLINTSRGGIINESDLYNALKIGHLSAAAIDVFDNEPYNGELTKIERCLLTAHMGSMSVDCRARMELEATEEVIRFLSDQPLFGSVPIQEYDLQRHE